MVSNNVIISICFAILFCILFPIITLIYLKRKEHFLIKTVFFGALGFILFSQVLEKLLHYFVLSTKLIPLNTMGFAIYAALAAGFFEEIGRFIMFKIFLKKTTHWKDGLGYGIGHGGIEAILIGSLGYLNSLIIALSVNSGQIDSLLKGQDASVIETVKSSVINATVFGTTMGGFERIFAFIIQIALTFVVLYGIRQRKNIYLFIAISLHALIDFIPALYQTKIITNIYVVECIILLCSIIAFSFILKSKNLFKTTI